MKVFDRYERCPKCGSLALDKYDPVKDIMIVHCLCGFILGERLPLDVITPDTVPDDPDDLES